MFTNFTTQYLPPILLVIIFGLGGAILLYLLSCRGIAVGGWDRLVRYKGPLGFLFVTLMFVVAFATFLVRLSQATNVRDNEVNTYQTEVNLISGRLLALNPITSSIYPAQPTIKHEESKSMGATWIAFLEPNISVATNVICVRAGDTIRYSYDATNEVQSLKDAPKGQVQPRLIWFDASLRTVGYTDRPPIATTPIVLELDNFGNTTVDTSMFHTETYKVPEGVTSMQLEFRNTGSVRVKLYKLKLSTLGVYVESHPNATSGSIAFSFDWETAMGGAIHSKGDDVHDVAGAEQHGMEMREGADWLNNLFVTNSISATFYATGYNLLDGNTDKKTFSGNPTYTWASRKDGWASEYWLTHPWFSDDPFGTYQSKPAWYFGDQTRALLAAGHEIAPHTFAHIYVRGSNPEELATDLDEWIKYAKEAGVPPPTTFAFPWRSSNSLTKEFYDVMYSKGIRAVTRIYAPDMKDLYTLGNALVYTDITQAQAYPDMPVMPDFLLGSPSTSAGEEAGGAPITRDQGLDVIAETIARRGTTSFWQHPEQLAPDPVFDVVRQAWTDVAHKAAQERDNGRLWIATVADITEYQRDVMSVTVSLQAPGLFGGKWRMDVHNDSGKELRGVTLTLPGEATSATDPMGIVQSVAHPDDKSTSVSAPGNFVGPSRQIVLSTLAPGTTTIEIEWAKGQEPPR